MRPFVTALAFIGLVALLLVTSLTRAGAHEIQFADYNTTQYTLPSSGALEVAPVGLLSAPVKATAAIGQPILKKTAKAGKGVLTAVGKVRPVRRAAAAATLPVKVAAKVKPLRKAAGAGKGVLTTVGKIRPVRLVARTVRGPRRE